MPIICVTCPENARTVEEDARNSIDRCHFFHKKQHDEGEYGLGPIEAAKRPHQPTTEPGD